MSHTPGPWRIQDAGNDTLWIVVDSTATDVGYISIAEARYGCDAARALGDNTANAQIMKAAPDLLAALRDAMPLLRGHSGTEEGQARYAAAMAAIAAAEGK